MLSNVLLVYFDPTVNQCSPVEPDTIRVVKKDEKGTEYVSYEPFDSAAYQKSLGLVTDWSLDSLLAAGIDPRFGVSTGSNTRLGLVGAAQDAVSQINSVIESEKSE